MDVSGRVGGDARPTIAKLIGIALRDGWKIPALLAAFESVPALFGLELGTTPGLTIALLLALAPPLIFHGAGIKSRAGVLPFLISGAVVIISVVFPLILILSVVQTYDESEMATLALLLFIPTNVFQATLIALASKPILARYLGHSVAMPKTWVLKVVGLTAILALLLSVIAMFILVLILTVPLQDRVAEALAASIGSIPAGFAISFAFVAMARFEAPLWSNR